MSWTRDDSLESFLRDHNILPVRSSCPSCGALAGVIHKTDCDVERCSTCGRQFLLCGCGGHDHFFACWTGFWPGVLESIALGFLTKWQTDPCKPAPADFLCRGTSVDLNRFYSEGWHKGFFVKPLGSEPGSEAVAKDAERKPHTVESVLADPAASFWLKESVRSALSRDPVDAANDADILASLLNTRCKKLFEDLEQSNASG
jgi:hypothetical protein